MNYHYMYNVYKVMHVAIAAIATVWQANSLFWASSLWYIFIAICYSSRPRCSRWAKDPPAWVRSYRKWWTPSLPRPQGPPRRAPPHRRPRSAGQPCRFLWQHPPSPHSCSWTGHKWVGFALYRPYAWPLRVWVQIDCPCLSQCRGVCHKCLSVA